MTRALRPLRSFVVAVSLSLAVATSATAHDLERTQVTLTFARDGSFVLDVANDPSWLALRLERFPGSFADRVVLWVDGHEIRPTAVEYLPPPAHADPDAVARATYRLRGRMPLDAHTLRWYYGLVIDPYPLTIHRADGRLLVEEIGGNAWSRTIDVSGQFSAPVISPTAAGVAVAVLFLIPITLRLLLTTRDTKDTKQKTCTV